MRSRRVALVTTLVVAMLLAFAPAASATDIAIGALTADCDGGTISFEVGTDRTGDAATHPAIRVEWAPAGSGAWVELGTAPLAEENGWTYADSVPVDLTGLQRVDVRATALTFVDGGGPWGDGRLAGDSYTSSFPVDPCSDTDPTEHARVNFTLGCRSSAGEPGVLLFNEDDPVTGSPLTFDVRAEMDGLVSEESVEVAPGGQETVLLTFVGEDGVVDPEDRSIAVVVSIGDRDEFVRTLDVDCEPDPAVPSADAGTVCTAPGQGVLEVELTNEGEVAATFVVTVDGDVVDEVAIGQVSSVRSYDVAEGEHTVLVTADGATVLDTTVLVDCEPAPAADVTTSCADGGLLLTLRNPDAPSAVFEVLVDGELVDTVEVAAEEVALPVTVTDGTRTVLVRVGDHVVLDETLDVDCVDEPPVVTVDAACDPTGTVLVTLTNPSQQQITFTVVLRDGATEVVVPAGATVVEERSVQEGSGTVTVLADGVEVRSEQLDTDCVVTPVTAEADAVCRGDGVLLVDLGNADQRDADVVVLVDGEERLAQQLAAGTATTVELPVADGTRAVVVTDDGVVVLDETLEVDCTDVLSGGEDSDTDAPTDGTPDPGTDAPVDGAPQDPQDTPETLAATGVGTTAWVLLAVLLLVLGAAALRTAQPTPATARSTGRSPATTDTPAAPTIPAGAPRAVTGDRGTTTARERAARWSALSRLTWPRGGGPTR